MSASNKRFTRWHAFGALVIALSVSMPILVSGADADKKKAAEDAQSVKNTDHPRTRIESMARLTFDSKGGPVFKCWQEGRLVFESAAQLADDQKLANAISVRGENGQAIQLLDLKQGLCVLAQPQ